jgi:deoxyribose-phosphate aldolase
VELTREQLVEIVTRQVMAALEGRPASQTAWPDPGSNPCAACDGACPAYCTDRVRAVVAAGASRIGHHPRSGFDTRPQAAVPPDLASYIDHTLLRPEATPDQVRQLCDEARQYHFASVCINPVYVRLAARLLHGSGIPVCSVIGFPLGATPSEIKAAETRRAIRDGAREIDMVIPVGLLKAGDQAAVRQDIARVVDACHEAGAICKVIIEAALLTDNEKVIACRLAKAARADFVKTSTGFGPGGATEHDVALMRAVVGATMGVKAAGGIRSAEEVEKMIQAGANRIGASASVKIVKEARRGS